MKVNYNELSTVPLSINSQLASERIKGLIKTFGESKKKGFNKIRFDQPLSQIQLADGYSIQDWLIQTSERTLKSILLGAYSYPFMSDEDVAEQDEFLGHNFYFEDSYNNITKRECLGLAAAHIYNTLAISFSGGPSWEKNSISIEKVKDGIEVSESVDVSNVYSPGCFNKEPILDYIEQISEIELIETTITPNEKSYDFRDDHGKDKLIAFAKRLFQSPYVIEAINSLPFNPKSPRFVRRIHPDGKIELVLYWEDAGYGMVIQTTGRNIRETEAIAKSLEKYI